LAGMMQCHVDVKMPPVVDDTDHPIATIELPK